MTQDYAFDVRSLGLGRAPATPPRDRAFAMPITGLGLGVGDINMPPQKIESSPWHDYVGPAAGSSGKSAELKVVDDPIFPHGVPAPSQHHGVFGLPTGVGAFADNAVRLAGVGQLVNNLTIQKAFSCPAGSSWVDPAPAASLSPYTTTQVMNAIQKMLAGGVAPAADGFVYFTISGTSGGKFRYAPGSYIAVCQAGVVTASPSGGSNSIITGILYSATGVPRTVSAVPSASYMGLPLPVTAPPPGVPVFQTTPGQGQFCWVYNSTGVARPSAPPPGVTLPGGWAQVRPHYWAWYPQDGVLSVINTYYVFSHINGVTGQSSPSPVGPTSPPPQLVNVPGQWVWTNPFYWVYVPTTTALAVAPTSYTWLWWLLGLGAAGAGAYYLLD